ncbi:Alpha/beta hydrolase fold-1 [Abortiporus biennis]|nr:Alpha/beta hydrolase fold-1 [Abortiporus biennis]
MAFQTESFTFDPRPSYPLVTTAKRYTHPLFQPNSKDAFTLLFTHGSGFHKEHWEPTLQDLVSNLGQIKVKEVWSIDCPNHGDAAILNENVLGWGYDAVFPWEEYARTTYLFLTNQGTGIPVDFSKHKVIGIGHSMGAIALMLSRTYTPTLPLRSIILVEPMLIPRPGPDIPTDIKINFEGGAIKRRDIWKNVQEASEFFKGRKSFQIWDERVLDIFIEHGLRPLPTLIYPDATGVTLKCPRTQEVACYRDQIGRTRAYSYLPYLTSDIPVHFIFGAINDALPEWVKDNVLATCKEQQASFQRVEGAGHLVVQMQPKRLAEKIRLALIQIQEGTWTTTRAVESRL